MNHLRGKPHAETSRLRSLHWPPLYYPLRSLAGQSNFCPNNQRTFTCHSIPNDPIKRQAHASNAPTSTFNSKTVLLQTAKAWAIRHSNNILVRILDSGSQRTFIQRDVSENVGCSELGNEEINIFTFGNTRIPKRHYCRRVLVTMLRQYNDTQITLEALEIPELCTMELPSHQW